jgi:AraC-like DNA-binding protein
VQLIRYRPAPPLDRYIEWLWWSYRDRPQAHGEHMLPSGCAQLVFLLHEQAVVCRPSASPEPLAWTGSVVHGPQSSYFRTAAKPKGAAVGVSFRPGAAGAVLGVPLNEFADRHVGLDAVWGARATDLRQRLRGAVSPQQLFRILETDLCARIHRPLLMHPAIAHALASHPSAGTSPATVTSLARASGYSPRHFIALFRAAVGFAPKHYYRIRRFNAAASSLAAADAAALSQIAATHGYADQSHLTREFREFAGTTPARYAPEDATRPLHHRSTHEAQTPGT